jgi:hypothetical protein
MRPMWSEEKVSEQNPEQTTSQSLLVEIAS